MVEWLTYIVDAFNIRLIVVLFFLEDVLAELAKFCWVIDFSWNDSFKDFTTHEKVVIFLQDITHLLFVYNFLDGILVGLQGLHIFIPIFVVGIGSQADFC